MPRHDYAPSAPGVEDGGYVEGRYLTRQVLDRVLPQEPCPCGDDPPHIKLAGLVPGCHQLAGWEISYAEGQLYLACSECLEPWWVIPVGTEQKVS